jgi:hypothetical protein
VGTTKIYGCRNKKTMVVGTKYMVVGTKNLMLWEQIYSCGNKPWLSEQK